MRAVVQRVRSAAVRVAGGVTGTRTPDLTINADPRPRNWFF